MIDFGLDSLDELQKSQEEGLPVQIRKPGTDEVLLTIVVCGPDSRQAERAAERNSEEMLARGAQQPLTPEERQDASARFLARCCMSWEFKGAVPPAEFTEDNVLELIKRYKLVRIELDQAVSNRTRFIKRS